MMCRRTAHQMRDGHSHRPKAKPDHQQRGNIAHHCSLDECLDLCGKRPRDHHHRQSAPAKCQHQRRSSPAPTDTNAPPRPPGSRHCRPDHRGATPTPLPITALARRFAPASSAWLLAGDISQHGAGKNSHPQSRRAGDQLHPGAQRAKDRPGSGIARYPPQVIQQYLGQHLGC